ncbi:MAG: PH domain-containing protein [Acidimicrobiales bacterium]
MSSVASDVDHLFTPPTGEWVPVSPRLATARRTVLCAWGAITAIVWGSLTIGLGATVAPVLAVIGLVGLVVIVVAVVTGLALIGRAVRAWGYTLADDIFYIRRGRIFRKLIAVPYARLQFVDVTAGPVDRWFKLATVQLHTASAGTDASIPGLPAERAAELRDTLTTMSEGRYAGL